MSDQIHVKVHSYGPGRPLGLVWFDPITGKKVAKSSGTFDEKEAIGKAAIMQAELNSGKYKPAIKITWKEFTERYEQEHLAGLSPSYADRTASAFSHVERIINPDRLSKLTTATMSRFQGELRKGDGTAEHPPVRQSTLDSVLRHIKAALRWAERVGLMNEAPRITAKATAKSKGRPITAEEFDRLIAAAPKVRSKDSARWVRLLTGLWLSGLRLGEALALSWDADVPFAIDLSGKHPAFHIDAQAQKSRRDEVLPLTPDFAEWLLQTPEEDRHGPVFKMGTVAAVGKVGEIVSRIGKKAGVVVNKGDGKYASAHDLRRSFGTRWAKKVMPAVLQRLMRHANINTTMTYYVNINADEVADGLWEAHKPAPGNTLGNNDPQGAQNKRGATATTTAETPCQYSGYGKGV